MTDIDPALLAVLACPQSRDPLRHDSAADELVCTGTSCGLAFPIRDGIPVLLIDEARPPRSGG
ncbi:MAG TPA: Trm112 family protein [Sporichthyaceae bacterium]|nr:Trm112 family protein [Sporichthyaceae bacterium]